MKITIKNTHLWFCKYVPIPNIRMSVTIYKYRLKGAKGVQIQELKTLWLRNLPQH